MFLVADDTERSCRTNLAIANFLKSISVSFKTFEKNCDILNILLHIWFSFILTFCVRFSYFIDDLKTSFLL